MMTRTKPPGPPPGDKPGDQNFYARGFSKIELQELRTALSPGLHNEIALLRVALLRMFEIANSFQDPAESFQALSALGLAATRLATLVKTDFLVNGNTDSTAEILRQALAEVADELIINKPKGGTKQ